MKQKTRKVFKKKLLQWFTANTQGQPNFDVHKRYLIDTVFKSYKDLINLNEYEKACGLFNLNKTQAVDEIFEVLKPAYESLIEEQREKGQALLNSTHISRQNFIDKGNGVIEVPSSKGNGAYECDLINGTCACQDKRTWYYTGVYCKHLMSAHELYGKKYHTAGFEDLDDESNEVLIKGTEGAMIVKEEEYLIYGSQKLKIRPDKSNSLIPSQQDFILEGATPEIIFCALNANDCLYLIGPSGAGKTSIIKHICHETNTPLPIINGNEHITTDDFVGTMVLEKNKTVWSDGVLIEAMKKGYYLLIDEVNAIDPGCLKYLNSVADSKTVMVTIADKPVVVKAHKDFRLIVTSNPPDSPIYKGIGEHSFDFIDRFIVVPIRYLQKKKEIQLIKQKTGLKDTVAAEQIVNFANDIRNGLENGEIFSTVTTRALIDWANKAKIFDYRTAAEVTIFSKMNTNDRKKALSHFNNYFK